MSSETSIPVHEAKDDMYDEEVDLDELGTNEDSEELQYRAPRNADAPAVSTTELIASEHTRGTNGHVQGGNLSENERNHDNQWEKGREPAHSKTREARRTGDTCAQLIEKDLQNQASCEADLDGRMMLQHVRKRVRERKSSSPEEPNAAHDEYIECCDVAVESALDALTAAYDSRCKAEATLECLRDASMADDVSHPGNCHLLVKYPLGMRPIEMWITAPAHLEIRPPEVIECFTLQLSRSKIEHARRRLHPRSLMIVDMKGGILSVANTLAASAVRPGDILLLLPSLARLNFLVNETSQFVRLCMSEQAKKHANEPQDKVQSRSDCTDKTGSGEHEQSFSRIADNKGRSELQVGEECWVETPDKRAWRRATVAASAPAGFRTGVVLVRWAENLTIDEPCCAQVEVDKVRRKLPGDPSQPASHAEDWSVDDAPGKRNHPVEASNNQADQEQPKCAPQCAPFPKALEPDNSLRVQIIWRLGKPAEALAAWLRVPSPYGNTVKPRKLMQKFAKRLASERPELRWRLVAAHLCLATLDGAPLDEAVPVATSLSAVASRRARSASEQCSSSDVAHPNCDAFENEWRCPPQEAEETLIALPRMDDILGASKIRVSAWDQARNARTDREGWIIEPDGTLTACTMLCGSTAPVRNRIASTSSPLLEVALAAFMEVSNADAELNKNVLTRQAATRITGGDVVLVETDRRTRGDRSRLRQVKLSQIVFADELRRGAGPYARRPAYQEDGTGPRAAIPGVPTGVVWYDDDAARRDILSIEDVRDKLLLQSVLPEFRRNGKLVAGGRRRLQRGQRFDLIFPYKCLGISIALAREPEASVSSTARKPRRMALVVDSIGPDCPPHAQLTLSPGDELVRIDGAPVEATYDGYQVAVAKLRCRTRPVKLSFKKSKNNTDSIPPAPYSTTAAGTSLQEGLPAPHGSIHAFSATEIAVVDLTEKDCLDCDLDEEYQEEEGELYYQGDEVDLDCLVQHTTTTSALRQGRPEHEMFIPRQFVYENYDMTRGPHRVVADLDESIENEATVRDYISKAHVDESCSKASVNMDDGARRYHGNELKMQDQMKSDVFKVGTTMSMFCKEGSKHRDMSPSNPSGVGIAANIFARPDDLEPTNTVLDEDEYSLAITSTSAETVHGQHFFVETPKASIAQNGQRVSNEDGTCSSDASHVDARADVVHSDNAMGDVEYPYDNGSLPFNPTSALERRPAGLNNYNKDLEGVEASRHPGPMVLSSALTSDTGKGMLSTERSNEGGGDSRAYGLPFERTPRPMQPLSTQVHSIDEGVFGALLEPASPVATPMSLRQQPVESVDELQFCVYDRRGNYRACLCLDGSVKSNRNHLLGYINLETIQAGSATEDFLGELVSETPSDGELCARGPYDEFCAAVDLPGMRLRDRRGSTFLKVSRSGELIVRDGSRLGRFDPFSPNDFQAVVLYVLFLDPGIVSPLEVHDDEAGL